MLVNNFPCHIDNDIHTSNLKKVHLVYKDKSNFLLLFQMIVLFYLNNLKQKGKLIIMEK